MPFVVLAAPVVPYDHSLCTLDSNQALEKGIQQEIEKIIKKVPLRYLQIGDRCQMHQSLYVSLVPRGGSFSGYHVEMILLKGKVFQRIKLCDNCPFSPWKHIMSYPFEGKKDKKITYLVCPDGSIRFEE